MDFNSLGKNSFPLVDHWSQIIAKENAKLVLARFLEGTETFRMKFENAKIVYRPLFIPVLAFEVDDELFSNFITELEKNENFVRYTLTEKVHGLSFTEI